MLHIWIHICNSQSTQSDPITNYIILSTCALVGQNSHAHPLYGYEVQTLPHARVHMLTAIFRCYVFGEA